MITTLLGLILLAIPFVLLSLFKDKKRGFIYILFFLAVFHTVLALTTQSFGVFYYWVVASISLLADAVLLLWAFRNYKKISLKLKATDWFLLAVILISFLSLYQVHYNYTGKINLATDQTVSYHEVKNMEYTYPYFSDEWYSVLLIKNSITSHSLPVNGFDGVFFPNLEIFFHSLLSEMTLIIGLDPLTQYVILSIFISVLVIVLSYMFLRISNVSKFSSALASLSILYIASGANLPGIWNLIPVNMGVLFFLIGFCFLAMGSLTLGTLALTLAAIFYPPFLIFSVTTIIAVLLHKFFQDKNKMLKAVSSVFAGLLAMVLIFYAMLMFSPYADFISKLSQRIIYISFLGQNMPQFNPFSIIPWQIILSAIVGIPFVYKNKKWLFYTFLLLTVFWFFYSMIIYRLVIEYEKIVFFASMIAVLIAGFGFDRIVNYFELKVQKARIIWLKWAEIAILCLFAVFLPFYTQRESWNKLVLVSQANGAVFYPKSPANNYLVPDDLRVFKDIKNKKFLSIPWKGTVIGVATDNYPAITKEGTISVGNEVDAYAFSGFDCKGKTEIAKKYGVDYVYMYSFDCPEFSKIDASKEGFILYKFK